MQAATRMADGAVAVARLRLVLRARRAARRDGARQALRPVAAVVARCCAWPPTPPPRCSSRRSSASTGPRWALAAWAAAAVTAAQPTSANPTAPALALSGRCARASPAGRTPRRGAASGAGRRRDRRAGRRVLAPGRAGRDRRRAVAGRGVRRCGGAAARIGRPHGRRRGTRRRRRRRAAAALARRRSSRVRLRARRRRPAVLYAPFLVAAGPGRGVGRARRAGQPRRGVVAAAVPGRVRGRGREGLPGVAGAVRGAGRARARRLRSGAPPGW